MFRQQNSPHFSSSKQVEDAGKVFVKMPVRNSKSGDQHTTLPRRSPRFFRKTIQIHTEPTTILRRSPRFLGDSGNEPDHQKTHNQENRVPFSKTTFISTPNMSLKTSKTRSSKAGNVPKESNFDLEASGKQNKGSRRSEGLKAGEESFNCRRPSSRLSGKENINFCTEGSNFNKFKKNEGKECSGNKVMRVTRSSTGKTSKVTAICATPIRSIDCKSSQCFDNGSLSDEGTAQVVIGSPKQSVPMTNISNQQNADSGFERKGRLGLDPSDRVLMVPTSSRVSLEVEVAREVRGIERKQKCIGVKRKRNQVDGSAGNSGVVNGWTADQESALQRAYFTAKPTPHFWKKVARMVPGKSAQDCFNRIHADYMTPPQPKPRSRAKAVNLSPLRLSASKLLDSTRAKAIRRRCTKQKSDIVHKTIRQLMQKQYQVDRDQNADLFSVLEPKSSASTNILQQRMRYSTPKQEKFKLLETCLEIPSLACRKQCSRFNRLDEGTLASPPVLKPVKNKALHEKYIDQLHIREAKRNAAFAKAAKSNLKILYRNNESCFQNINAIKSAKDALLVDARDAINQFQHVQVNGMSNLSDVDDDVFYSDEDTNEGR